MPLIAVNFVQASFLNLDLLDIYWVFAIVGTVWLTISTILAFYGAGDHSGLDVDVDMDGDIDIPHVDTGFLDLKIFSVRAILAFFTMFGWGGVVFGDRGWTGFFLSFFCGLVMMFLTALCMALVLKLQQNGTVKNSSLKGKTGVVYLSVPAGRVGRGLVTVAVNGASKEVSVISDNALDTGTSVVLKEYLGQDLFLACAAPEQKSVAKEAGTVQEKAEKEGN